MKRTESANSQTACLTSEGRRFAACWSRRYPARPGGRSEGSFAGWATIFAAFSTRPPAFFRVNNWFIPSGREKGQSQAVPTQRHPHSEAPGKGGVEARRVEGMMEGVYHSTSRRRPAVWC